MAEDEEPSKATLSCSLCLPIPLVCSQPISSTGPLKQGRLSHLSPLSNSLSQLLPVIRQLLPVVGEVVRPPYVLPREKPSGEPREGERAGMRSEPPPRPRSPAQVLHPALPGLPQLHVPPQRLLQLQHRGVLHHHHGCGAGRAGSGQPAAPRPRPPAPAPHSRTVSPSALHTRTVMACPYSRATCEPISSAVTCGRATRP